MKTVRFFWNYFKVYKFSFVIVVLMVAVATIAQALFPVFSGQAVTELANLVLAYQNGTSELAWQSLSALMLNLALVVLALVVSSLIYMTLMTRVIAESTNEWTSLLQSPQPHRPSDQAQYQRLHSSA
jgi:ATP-binding cassette, subfamily B, multidrug efflux pump